MRRLSSLFLGSALLLALPAPAQADECASDGPVAFSSMPLNGATIAANSRFSVDLFPSCGGVEGGPRHRMRLLDARGGEIPLDERETVAYPDCKPAPCLEIELVPKAPLPSGSVRLQVQRPVDETSLSEWEDLARYMASAEIDAAAPRFVGIERAEAKAVEGSVALSPCESVPGWELEERFAFRPADDGRGVHDELLYFLDRQPLAGGPWARVASFRPEPLGGGLVGFKRRTDEWQSAFRYRVRVRDAAGNETVGAAAAELTAPPRPERELWNPDASGAPLSPEPHERPRSGCGGCAAATPHDRGLTPWAALAVLLAARRRLSRGTGRARHSA